MSIVGTRPPLISETNLYEPRHKVRSYQWSGFLDMLTKAYPLAKPRIYVSIYGCFFNSAVCIVMKIDIGGLQIFAERVA